MADLTALRAANIDRWQKAKVSPSVVGAIDAVARRLLAGKARYQSVSKTTGMPWAVIAVIHEREASGSWSANIAQGDPWSRKSVHVPIGRGPFDSWEAAAYDALTACPPYASRWKDWTPGGALTLLEQYNGLGYASKGVPSPYIWSGTDQYVSGKYVADHVYDSSAVDRQLGCAALLQRMIVLDASAQFGVQPPPDVEPVAPKPAPPPAKKAAGIAALVAAAMTAIASTFHAHPILITAGFGLTVAAVIALVAIHLHHESTP